MNIIQINTAEIRNNSKFYFLLAFLLFFLPFGFYIHKLFSETSNIIVILGYNLHHNYHDNEHMIWSVSIRLISLSYLILWLLICKRKNRLYAYISLLPFIYLLFRTNVHLASPLENNFVLISVFLYLLIIGFLRFKNKKVKFAFSKDDKIIDVFFPLVILFFCLLFVISYNSIFEQFAALFINDYGFGSATNFIWYLSLKMLVVCPLVYWFLIEKRWFRYALLSPIVIFSMQLFNAVNNIEMPIDEIEIFQTLHFTVPLFVILIFLAKAFDNQEKIKYWLANQYTIIEVGVKDKYKRGDSKILENRKKIEENSAELTDLEKIKISLEQELKNLKSS